MGFLRGRLIDSNLLPLLDHGGVRDVRNVQVVRVLNVSDLAIGLLKVIHHFDEPERVNGSVITPFGNLAISR